MSEKRLDASILPFTGSETDEPRIVIYVVSGTHAGITVPKSFCKECHLFASAAQDAVEELDMDVAISVRSYWTRFLWPLLHGGYHPPVMMIDGHVITQGYAVPDPEEIKDAIRERYG